MAAQLATSEPVWCMQPRHRDGKATVVRTNLSIMQVSDVDTAKGSAFIKMLVWLKWHDQRIVGWNTKERPLPKDLWTPRLKLEQSKNCMQVTTLEIDVDGRFHRPISDGSMYSLTEYEGEVENTMQCLKDFPVDMDSMELTLNPCEMYTSEGIVNVQFKCDYRLVLDSTLGQVAVQPEDLCDWVITGTWTKVNAGFRDEVQIGIRMKRKTMFYVWKVLVPLGLTVFMGIYAFFMEVQDLGDRQAHLTTLLLSTFALIYVVSTDLPKTDFLTSIDVVMLTTMALLVLSGAMCVVINELDVAGEVEAAGNLNLASMVGVPVTYLVVAMAQMLPRVHKRRRQEAEFRARAIAAGNSPDSTTWSVFDPSVGANVKAILGSPDGQDSYDRVVAVARKQKREAMSEDAEKAMLAKGAAGGILRLDVDHKWCCFTWTEYDCVAREQAGGLPTVEELKASGVNAGDGVDQWMPVRRADGIKDDYCQIGNHGAHPGLRYLSHKDVFGPTGWQEGRWPYTWRPLEYIYVKKA